MTHTHTNANAHGHTHTHTCARARYISAHVVSLVHPKPLGQSSCRVRPRFEVEINVFQRFLALYFELEYSKYSHNFTQLNTAKGLTVGFCLSKRRKPVSFQVNPLKFHPTPIVLLKY